MTEPNHSQDEEYDFDYEMRHHERWSWREFFRDIVIKLVAILIFAFMLDTCAKIFR